MLKRIRSERGFTLVELLVVLAILAILIAIVVPNLAGLTGGAKARAAQTELQIVQTAMDTMIARYEAITVQSNSTPTPITPPYAVSIWVVSYYDPATGTEYYTNSTGTIELRSITHGSYTWDTTGRVTQTAYP
jgi:type IV pilus assembly protein PilA